MWLVEESKQMQREKFRSSTHKWNLYIVFLYKHFSTYIEHMKYSIGNESMSHLWFSKKFRPLNFSMSYEMQWLKKIWPHNEFKSNYIFSKYNITGIPNWISFIVYAIC